MDLRLDRDHVVRRDWLPLFAIIWMSVVSLLVVLRLALRATSRSLGLDDVSQQINEPSPICINSN